MIKNIFIFSLSFLTISVCASEKESKQLLLKKDDQPSAKQERPLRGLLADGRDEYNKGCIEVEGVELGVIPVTNETTVEEVKGIIRKSNPKLGNSQNNWCTFDLYEKFPDFLLCCCSFTHIGQRPLSNDRLIKSCDSTTFVVKKINN